MGRKAKVTSDWLINVVRVRPRGPCRPRYLGRLHCKCEKINEEAYAVLNMENIHWFCGACNSVVGRVLPTLANLEMKQTKLEDELKVITADVSNVKSKCEKAVSDMETVKSHHYKLAEDVNTLKKDTNTQFVRDAEKILEVKGDNSPAQ